MRQSSLLVLLPLLAIVLMLPASNAASYPPPQLPSELKLITVHSTTINFTGPASESFTFDISKIDGLSLIPELILNTTAPLTDFSIQIIQLNYLPTNIATPGGNLILPSGKPLLYFYFNIDPTVQSDIGQAEFYIRVPAQELQLFTANPAGIIVQKYLYSWTTETSFLSSTGISEYYVQHYTYGVFSSGPLTLYAVTETQAHGLTPLTILLLVITIPLAIFTLTRRTRLKNRITTQPSQANE